MLCTINTSGQALENYFTKGYKLYSMYMLVHLVTAHVAILLVLILQCYNFRPNVKKITDCTILDLLCNHVNTLILIASSNI